MAAPINTNVASLNSQRALSSSNESLATSLKRLSSGLRINSAKDDAAGLAISQRMTSQINGLNQAARNANDGISLAQTAEGGLASIGESLQRMRSLAVQASNATNSATDRAALQAEVDQLVEQINTVATQTSFNGIKLLDGTFNSQTFQVGANKGETININSISSAKTDALGVGTNSSYSAEIVSTAVNGDAIASGGITVNGFGIGPSVSDGVSYAEANSVTGAAASANTNTSAATASGLTINNVAIGDITIAAGATAAQAGTAIAAAITAKSSETGVTAAADTNGAITLSAADGRSITIGGTVTDTGLTAATTTGTGSSAGSAIAQAAAFNAVSGQTGVTATVTATSVTGAAAAANAIAGDTTDFIKINGVQLGAIAAGGTAVEQANNVTAAINAVSNQTGVTATFDKDGKITLNAADGRNVNVQTGGTGVGGSGLTAGTTFGGIKLSSNSENGITVGGADVAKAGLSSQYQAATAEFGKGLSTVDISTAAGAASALEVIDAALANVNSSRASLGAIQNRFESVVSNLNTSAENITASRSRILDADFAAETANLSRAQVLQQAGTAMLAQANALPQNVLSLLR